MNKEFYKKIENYMLNAPKDSCHDEHHSYRVLYSALEIAKNCKEKVNLEILIVSALLHDISRVDEIKNPSICHAKHGSIAAYDYLLEQGYDEDKALHVKQCIASHRYRKSCTPATIEAKILFDADKLDAMGSIGIARALNYTGTINRPFYKLDENNKISEGTEKGNSFLQEYHYKLKNLHERLYTDSAKEIAKVRIEHQQQYYDSFLQELNEIYEYQDMIYEVIDDE